MRGLAVAAVVLLGFGPAPAFAEEDYMEAQRCIWRCLANARSASDPAYQRCIDRHCNGPSEAKPQKRRSTPKKRRDR